MRNGSHPASSANQTRLQRDNEAHECVFSSRLSRYTRYRYGSKADAFTSTTDMKATPDAAQCLEFRKTTSIATTPRKRIIPKLLTIRRLQMLDPLTTLSQRMSANSEIVRTTCGAILILALATQSATAREQRARKHHHTHTVSQWRPWNANAAMTQSPSDPWWSRFANGAGSAPVGH